MTAELYTALRECERGGMSQRATAKYLGISRNTVKKYWQGSQLPDTRAARKVKDSERKQMVKEIMAEYMREHKDNEAAKQKIHANTVWQYLRDERKIRISLSSVCRYWNELKENTAKKAHMNLTFEPGEAAQVDWFEVTAYIDGVKRKAHCFAMVLMYSYAPFIAVFRDEKMESFLTGHVMALEFYGGTPRRIIYDNLRAVAQTGWGAGAVLNKQFSLLAAHYGFKPDLCNVKAPNEKGGVEDMAKFGKSLAFTPVPHVKNGEELQDLARERCLRYIRENYNKSRHANLCDLFEREKSCLQALPRTAYETHNDATAKVTPDQTFTFEQTRYSLPPEYIGMKVGLRVYAFRIEVYSCHKHIYTHRRSLAEHDNQIVAEHYLEQLRIKHRFPSNYAPLKVGILPPPMDEFREKCRGRDRYDQLRNVLLLLLDHDRESVLQAVERACAAGNPTYDRIKRILDAVGPVYGDSRQSDLSEYAVLMQRREEDIEK